MTREVVLHSGHHCRNCGNYYRIGSREYCRLLETDVDKKKYCIDALRFTKSGGRYQYYPDAI